MGSSQALTLGITALVIIACSGCLGGGSNAQTFKTNWGEVQINIPQKASLTSIEGAGNTITLTKGFTPLIIMSLSESSQTNDLSGLSSIGAKVNNANSNDNHKIYWCLNPTAGGVVKQYLGNIDYTADKNLLVSFIITPLYYDTTSAKITTVFEDEEVLDILKSFRFVETDSKSQSTQPTEKAQDPTFHMAVIGDSIAWGNGLNKEDKYPYLVADWLEKKLDRPIDVTVYAHSGATISGESGEAIDQNLNSGSPTLMDQAKNIKNKDDVDLILVSGGINDIGISNILDANTPSETIGNLAESIKAPMKDLLTYLLDETDAKIIVTGYYPIITEKSKVEPQDRAVAGLLATQSEKTTSQTGNVLITAIADPTAAKVKAAWYLLDGLVNNAANIFTGDANLRANSDTFYVTSASSLEAAVHDVDNKHIRVKFIDQMFGRENSYRASDSFLWVLNKDLKTNDDQYEKRAKLVEKTYALDLNPLDLDLIKRVENKINPVAHPNKKGAARYADSIKSLLDTPKELDWLQNDPAASSEAGITQDSITEISSDTSTPPEKDTSDANTKTAYTHDGISYISKERVEENIKAGVAKPGDYEEVQVPLDTFVVGGSTIPGET
jgi:lysophospholipase L1-like esterase